MVMEKEEEKVINKKSLPQTVCDLEQKDSRLPESIGEGCKSERKRATLC